MILCYIPWSWKIFQDPGIYFGSEFWCSQFMRPELQFRVCNAQSLGSEFWIRFQVYRPGPEFVSLNSDGRDVGQETLVVKLCASFMYSEANVIQNRSALIHQRNLGSWDRLFHFIGSKLVQNRPIFRVWDFQAHSVHLSVAHFSVILSHRGSFL